MPTQTEEAYSKRMRELIGESLADEPIVEDAVQQWSPQMEEILGQMTLPPQGMAGSRYMGGFMPPKEMERINKTLGIADSMMDQDNVTRGRVLSVLEARQAARQREASDRARLALAPRQHRDGKLQRLQAGIGVEKSLRDLDRTKKVEAVRLGLLARLGKDEDPEADELAKANPRFANMREMRKSMVEQGIWDAEAEDKYLGFRDAIVSERDSRRMAEQKAELELLGEVAAHFPEEDQDAIEKRFYTEGRLDPRKVAVPLAQRKAERVTATELRQSESSLVAQIKELKDDGVEDTDQRIVDLKETLKTVRDRITSKVTAPTETRPPSTK